MKASNYIKMSTAELNDELAKLKGQLFNLRFQLASGQLTNNQALVVCKRDIARVQTIIRQRELNIAEEPTAPKKKSK